MMYLCAGIFAEGSSDYRFLLPVTTRLLQELAPRLLPSLPEIADTVGIDAPPPAPKHRPLRIAAAIHDRWSECNLFIIHSDADGDPERARTDRVRPGIEEALRQHPDAVVVACVPVRELEAWMLADDGPFLRLFGAAKQPQLPSDPERERDPKTVVRSVLTDLGADLSRFPNYHAFFGANVDLTRLRALEGFRRFEDELRLAVEKLAGPTRSS